MEGQNEKVAQEIQEVDVPMVEEPEETPKESDEEYLDEDYVGEEGYPEGEYEDDDSWEEDVAGSEQAPLGGLNGWFKVVIKQPDSKRVINFSKEELGIWNLSVRDCERIALIADTFHHPGVAKFFIKQSRVISDTAMSKSGWLTELFITSKKFASRDSSSSIQNLPQFNKKNKWRVFSEKGNQQVREPVE